LDLQSMKALDAGAGEGKNAYFLAERGASVVALELSCDAIRNARKTFGASARVSWIEGDVRTAQLANASFDLVVAYGLFHCLSVPDEVEQVVGRLQEATVAGGWNVVCAFNARSQDLSAHPGFFPCLLEHSTYVQMYEGWECEATDSDLTEIHPHNKIEHTHSMTRIIARKPG